jgi:hypothetical protein
VYVSPLSLPSLLTLFPTIPPFSLLSLSHLFDVNKTKKTIENNHREARGWEQLDNYLKIHYVESAGGKFLFGGCLPTL